MSWPRSARCCATVWPSRDLADTPGDRTACNDAAAAAGRICQLMARGEMTPVFGEFLRPARAHIAAAVSFRGDLPYTAQCGVVGSSTAWSRRWPATSRPDAARRADFTPQNATPRRGPP